MSIIPKDATHRSQKNGKFYKFVGDTLMLWQASETKPGWFKSLNSAETAKLVPLIHQPAPWAGGSLPPVGITCKLSGPTAYLSPLNPDWAGREVKIYAHFVSDRGIEMAAYVGEHHDIGGVGIAALFVPIRTPEQVEAEELEERLVAMSHAYQDATGRSPDAYIHEAFRALDAEGYRKQVAP